jgi:hypothetical protein
VTDQDSAGVQPIRHAVKSAVARGAGSRLGTAVMDGDVDGDDLYRLESKPGQQCGNRRRPSCRALLEAVVDGDAADPKAKPRRLESGGGGERYGIAAATAGDEHQRGRIEPGKGCADRTADGGNRGSRARRSASRS